MCVVSCIIQIFNLLAFMSGPEYGCLSKRMCKAQCRSFVCVVSVGEVLMGEGSFYNHSITNILVDKSLQMLQDLNIVLLTYFFIILKTRSNWNQYEYVLRVLGSN